MVVRYRSPSNFHVSLPMQVASPSMIYIYVNTEIPLNVRHDLRESCAECRKLYHYNRGYPPQFCFAFVFCHT